MFKLQMHFFSVHSWQCTSDIWKWIWFNMDIVVRLFCLSTNSCTCAQTVHFKRLSLTPSRSFSLHIPIFRVQCRSLFLFALPFCNWCFAASDHSFKTFVDTLTVVFVFLCMPATFAAAAIFILRENGAHYIYSSLTAAAMCNTLHQFGWISSGRSKHTWSNGSSGLH